MKKKLKISLIIVIILAAVIIGTVVILSPKQLFRIAINNITNKVLATIEKVNNEALYENSEIDVNGKAKINLSAENKMIAQTFGFVEVIDFLSDVNINANIQKDTQNDLMQTNVAIFKNESEKLDFKLVSNKGKRYLKVPEVLEEYVQLEENKSEINEEKIYSNKELEEIVKIVKRATINNIENKYLKTKKETIDVDGKNVNVKKYILSLSEKQLVEYETNVFTELKNNKEFLELLDNDNLVKKVEEKIKEDTDRTDLTDKEVFRVEISRKSILDKPIRYEVYGMNENSEFESLFTLTNVNTITCTYEILYAKGKVNILEKENNEYEIKIQKGKSLTNINGKIDEENKIVNLTVSDNDGNNGNIVFKESTKNNYNLTYKVSQKSGTSIDINADIIVKENQTPVIDEIKNIKKMSEINQDEVNQKLIKKLSNMGLESIADLITSLSSLSSFETSDMI